MVYFLGSHRITGNNNENVNDDMRVLPFWKRFIAERYMAIPDSVSLAETSEDTLFATVAWLLATQDLTFVSVWSPTFLLTLIDQVEQHKDELIRVLEKGHWLDRAKSLNRIPCPKSDRAVVYLKCAAYVKTPVFLNTIWPQLRLISCWDTSSSSTWANEVRSLFPNACVQGKGLWATEGAVTFPLNGQYPLAINSHFYEFINLDSDSIIPSWELKKGMAVSPLLTTGSGLFRYNLKDQLVVDDFINQCPCLTFQGRVDGVDMVGEKISTLAAQEIIKKLSDDYQIKAVSILAIPADLLKAKGLSSKSKYILLCEATQASLIDHKRIAKVFELLLQRNFHYQLARDLHQLDEAVVALVHDARSVYEDRCKNRGMAIGNIKYEPLIEWNTPVPQVLTECLQEQ